MSYLRRFLFLGLILNSGQQEVVETVHFLEFQAPPPQHAPNLSRPLIRSNVPISGPPIYHPNPLTEMPVSFPAPPPLPVSNPIPPDFVPEVSVLHPPPHLPPPNQVELLANGDGGSGGPFVAGPRDDAEDEAEADPEDDACDKSDAGSFGFEVPDEVIVDGGESAAAVVEELDVRDDIPTPVQDENEEIIDEQQQQQQQQQQQVGLASLSRVGYLGLCLFYLERSVLDHSGHFIPLGRFRCIRFVEIRY